MIIFISCGYWLDRYYRKYSNLHFNNKIYRNVDCKSLSWHAKMLFYSWNIVMWMTYSLRASKTFIVRYHQHYHIFFKILNWNFQMKFINFFYMWERNLIQRALLLACLLLSDWHRHFLLFLVKTFLFFFLFCFHTLLLCIKQKRKKGKLLSILNLVILFVCSACYSRQYTILLHFNYKWNENENEYNER